MQRNLFKSILIFGILVLFFGTIAAIIYVGLTSDKSFTTSIQQDEYTLIGTTGSSMRNEDWWDYNWSYRKKITFNHTLISNNLSNFTALIYLDSDAEVASHAQVDGDDIVFVDWKDNVTKLNHEIEYYENGTLYAWVNVTRLCCSTDTNIWMYYGNPICSCQENVADTWDSHYTMVQHMTDLTALTTKDSTYRNFNGTKKGVNMPEEVNGKIFKGQDFSAANTEYIEIPTSYGEPNGIPLAPDYDVPWTIEAWIKRKTTGSDQAIMSKMYSYGTCTGWMLDIEDNDKINLWLVYRKNIPFFKWNQIETTETYTAVDRWYYVVGTCNGNTRTSGMNIFVNGNIVGKTTVSDTLDRNPPGGPEHTMADATANIGARRSDGIDNCHFDGIIDEVRFTYNAVRNASWINTSYMNQNDPESFITVDVEESK
ncbi:MAG TPA: DUF2341 domain-containing protein, partial [Thermoplasmatales archaeon]|nr:DUF2341 domain-containing protein [Thermoplasmatales archaeon]